MSAAWDRAKKNVPVKDAFTTCTKLLVVRIMTLTAELETIMPAIREILDFDGVDEDPDPWTLALAASLSADVVTEASVIRQLSDGCNLLALTNCDLAELILREKL